MGLRRNTTAFEPLREVVVREHPRDVDGLLEQLRAEDPERRRWAARDLAAYPDCSAQLGQLLLTERDPTVLEALFTTLVRHANDAAAAALMPLLRSEDAMRRNAAIEALSGMPQAIAPRIAALLRDADPDVRIFTVNLLGELRHEKVTEWLLQVLRQDHAVNVVAAAIEALAEAGGPEHVAALTDAVRRFPDDPFIAFATDMAVQRIEAE